MTNFRDMRRSRQRLDDPMVGKILETGVHGVLSVIGDGGYPYGVPVNYVFRNRAIFVHSSKKGHKVDAIAADPRVSFTVVADDTIVPEEFSSRYRSVIVFGRASFVEDLDERTAVFRALEDRYSPNEPDDERDKALHQGLIGAAVIRIDIEWVTGKQGKLYLSDREG